MRGRGGSALIRWGGSPDWTQRQNFFSAVDQDAEIERVHGDRDLHPLAAAGDDRQHRAPQMGDPHVVLELGHVLFGGRLLRERPGQHELGLEHRLGALHDAVEGCRHPGNGRMLDAALDVVDPPAGIALVPGAVEVLGGGPELHDEVAGQVLRLGLAPFLAPQADQGGFIAAHDDPGVRAADEAPAIKTFGGSTRGLKREGHEALQFSCSRISSATFRITPSASADKSSNRLSR